MPTSETPAARRGRPPRTSREAVVKAAVELADAQGLAAVTMRSVAAALGTGAMSLYSYVPDKRSLVQAMVARVAGEVRYPEITGSWRTDLHVLAHEQRTLVRRHPWLVEALATPQPLSPELLPTYEFGLAALEPLGVSPQVAMETLALVIGVVLNLVRAEAAADAAAAGAGGALGQGELRAEPGAHLRLVDADRFPRFAAALAAQPFDTPTDVVAQFDRLLDRFLDGLIPSAGGAPDA